MNKKILVFSAIALSALSFAQTGVGVMTENPQGQFHVDGAGDNATSGAPTSAQQVNDMIVLPSGNVGIGTIYPQNPFVISNGGAQGIEMHPNITLGLASGAYINPWNRAISDYMDLIIDVAGTSKAIVFKRTTGNVGIGTTDPKASLVVSNSGENGLEITPSLSLGSANGVYFNSWNRSTNVYSDMIFDFAGLSNIVVFKSIGNVGIGTTTPGSKLSVVGLVEYADNAAALGAGLVAGDFYRTGDVLKVVH